MEKASGRVAREAIGAQQARATNGEVKVEAERAGPGHRAGHRAAGQDIALTIPSLNMETLSMEMLAKHAFFSLQHCSAFEPACGNSREF